MAFDQTIHETLRRLTASLKEDIDARLKDGAAELAAAAEEERMAAEAEAMSSLAAEIASVRAEADQRVTAEAAKARADAEQAASVELSVARAELEGARREVEELKRAHDRASSASTELPQLRERLATAEQELAQLRRSESSGRIEERQEKLAVLDRLVASFRRLDDAATLSDVLAALTDGVGAEAPRSAILVASGDAFQPFITTGITGPARPLTPAEAAELSRGLPFAPLPPEHVGFSVPVVVGGKTVALVYADDASGQPRAVPASWPETVEALARHAALRLECLTALRTVQALSGPRAGAAPVSTTGRVAPAVAASTTEDDQSARRYARLLVSEIKLYNEGTVRLGRQNRDLLDRLRPEIDRARKLYEERVPAHVPARGTYFDDELVQTLADGDPGLLGVRR